MKKMEVSKKTAESIAEGIQNQLGDVAVSVIVRKKIHKTPDFVMFYQEVGKRILEGKMTLSSSKVFFYLMVTMSFENFIGIDMKTISEKIKMPLRTVTLAMKELKEAGIVMAIKNNFDNRRNDYRLNPLVVWKGKVNSRTKSLKENPMQISLLDQPGV
jgi:DNA-binding transcriptional ArsR family regulator